MQPNLRTPRLTLRPFDVTDADDVERMAGDFRVAETAAAIPHPYPNGAAVAWIATHLPSFAERSGIIYAITDSATNELLGAISLLDMLEHHARCEMGYWVAHKHWSTGVCTEAARAIIDYAHKELGITRVVARCLSRNVGSARVMEKAGLVREGYLAKHVNHRGVFEDLILYGIVLPGRQT